MQQFLQIEKIHYWGLYSRETISLLVISPREHEKNITYAEDFTIVKFDCTV